MSSNFWSGKKVLITGNTGFKGGWLTLQLIFLGAKVYGISLKPKFKNSLFNIFNLKKKTKTFFCDIRNEKKLEKIIKNIEPEIVFHLAAQPIVKTSYTKTRETYQVNANGTINVLEALKKLKKIKSIIVVTSDKCYLNTEIKKEFKESDPLGGFDPYSCSKACSELISFSYFHSFFKSKKIGLATARAGNIIGGGDWSDYRLIPDIIKSSFNKRKLIIRNPESCRPWQYVLDVTNGYLMLARKLHANYKFFSSAWNFGPNKHNSITVNQVCKLSNNFLKKKLKVKYEKSLLKESKYLFLSSKKSMKYLKWKNIYNLNIAIKSTIEWYENFYNNNQVYNFTLEQIKIYSNFIKKNDRKNKKANS